MADGGKGLGFASGKPGSAQYALTGGGLKDVYGGKWTGPKRRKISNRAKTYGVYGATTLGGEVVGGAAGAAGGALASRVLRGRLKLAAPIAGAYGGLVAGGLKGNMMGAKISHKRGYAKKSMSKGAGTLVKLPAKVGRFRGAAENTAIRGAGAAGRTLRYVRDNAMPLTIGATAGAGAATAYQQTKNRSNMSKGLPSALRPAPGKLVRAMRNPAVRSRIEANTAGRAAGWYASRGMTADAAQRARNGRNFRFKSSGTFERIGG